MQNKLDHSKRQQAFYRSDVKARPERNLRNAVLDKIAELEEVARKKQVKEVEKMNKLGKRQDNPLPSKSIEGQEKENETVKTDHRRDMQQISAVDLVQEQITETENMEAIAGGDKEQDPSQAEASKKGQKKLNPTYAYRLGELSTKLPTQDQVAALGHSMSMGPKHLGRTASTVHGHRHAKQWMTNGSTSQDLLLPSADTKKGFESHTRLTDLSQGQIIYMCGLHLTWLNPKHDEFPSYSKELLFLLVHALGRHHTGQRNVTIQYINRSEATTLEGEPAAFYDALDIYNIFGVPSRPGWSNYLDLALNPRKFTHEFLSHGIVKHNDATLKQARLEDLIKDGLFVFFPELEAPENHERCGLYTEQVALELDTLELARKLALNFVTVPAGTDPWTIEPPLHIFIQFLTLHKRQTANSVFTAWIQQHYNANAVSDLYKDTRSGLPLPGFTTVVDNLPGSMQYLNLVRDCIDVFSLEKLQPDIVQTENVIDDAYDSDNDENDEGDDDDEDSDSDEGKEDESEIFEEEGSDDEGSDDDCSEDGSDSDDSNYTTNGDRDIKLSIFRFAADDHIFHKYHFNISEPEAKKKKKKSTKETEVAPGRLQNTTGPDGEGGKH